MGTGRFSILKGGLGKRQLQESDCQENARWDMDFSWDERSADGTKVVKIERLKGWRNHLRLVITILYLGPRAARARARACQEISLIRNVASSFKFPAFTEYFTLILSLEYL